MSTLSALSKATPVRLKLMDFPKKQISVQQKAELKKGYLGISIMLRDLWILMWRSMFRENSAFTIH